MNSKNVDFLVALSPADLVQVAGGVDSGFANVWGGRMQDGSYLQCQDTGGVIPGGPLTCSVFKPDGTGKLAPSDGFINLNLTQKATAQPK